MFTRNILIRSFGSRNQFRKFSTTKISTVKLCDIIPHVDLYECDPPNKIDINSLCCNQRVVIFGVPGAFTPGCSKKHLPGYVKDADRIKSEQCIDHIICVAVNDPFVMAAWGLIQNANGKVRLFADPAGDFIKALDLGIDVPILGGMRSKRFSMIAENNQIIELNVEPDGTGLTVSLATEIGKT